LVIRNRNGNKGKQNHENRKKNKLRVAQQKNNHASFGEKQIEKPKEKKHSKPAHNRPTRVPGVQTITPATKKTT